MGIKGTNGEENPDTCEDGFRWREYLLNRILEINVSTNREMF